MGWLCGQPGMGQNRASTPQQGWWDVGLSLAGGEGDMLAFTSYLPFLASRPCGQR